MDAQERPNCGCRVTSQPSPAHTTASPVFRIHTDGKCRPSGAVYGHVSALEQAVVLGWSISPVVTLIWILLPSSSPVTIHSHYPGPPPPHLCLSQSMHPSQYMESLTRNHTTSQSKQREREREKKFVRKIPKKIQTQISLSLSRAHTLSHIFPCWATAAQPAVCILGLGLLVALGRVLLSLERQKFFFFLRFCSHSFSLSLSCSLSLSGLGPTSDPTKPPDWHSTGLIHELFFFGCLCVSYRV